MQSTSIRVTRVTQHEIKDLATRWGVTSGEAVARAVKLARQDRIGEQLQREISAEEQAWLDADLG